MIDLFIKSTISLGAMYLVYILVLSGIKTFKFNRYFLLGSLVLSLVIPFMSIPVGSDLMPLSDAMRVTTVTETIVQTTGIIVMSSEEGSSNSLLLPFIYATISLILLLRFGLNFFNIIWTIKSNQIERKHSYSIVLVDDQVLPHTFFNYIMVNKVDYKNGKIDDALLQHEVTHCKQWHSLDIVFIELIKVVLWINPFVWLFKKPIQLNHEYLADNSVLANQNINRYQNILINIVLGNNSGILISNFNFSFTKQRLKMMTKQFSLSKALFGKIASIFTFIFIALMISCNQKTFRQNSLTHLENDRGQPIHNVHNFNPTAYNDFENIFGMGSTDSLSIVLAMENAFIRLFKSNEVYSKLKSPMYREIDIEIIYSKNIHDKFYKLKDSDKVSEVVTPLLSFEFLHFQSEVRKKLNAKNMERPLNMNEEN